MLELLEHYQTSLFDIPWNFLIGDDGAVYEARGFKYQGVILVKEDKPLVAAAAPLLVSSSDTEPCLFETGIIVAFIGTFQDKKPSQNQIDAFYAFVDYSTMNGYVKEDFALLAQDQLAEERVPTEGLHEAFGPFKSFYKRKIYHCHCCNCCNCSIICIYLFNNLKR